VTKSVEDLIVEQLTRVEEKVDAVRTVDIPSIRERLKGVEVKSAISGAITGSIGGALTAFAVWMMKHM
jgi:hypothetical protein